MFWKSKKGEDEMNEEEVTQAITELLIEKKWTLKYIDVYTHPSDNSVSVTLRGIKEKMK